jgi:hypothetical protein
LRGIRDRVGREQAICEGKATVVPSGAFSIPHVDFLQRLNHTDNAESKPFRQKMPDGKNAESSIERIVNQSERSFAKHKGLVKDRELPNLARLMHFLGNC